MLLFKARKVFKINKKYTEIFLFQNFEELVEKIIVL